MTTKAEEYGVSNEEATEAWEAIDCALHNAILTLPKHVIDWLAEGTETTSILQNKAWEVLDFINPVTRMQNDGTSYNEAVANIARDIDWAKTRRKLDAATPTIQ